MNKPYHLSQAIGDQFGDKSVVENYQYRPVYSDAVIDTLSNCLDLKQMRVLDIGSGTGEVSIPLSLRGHSVVGVDPSKEMIRAAQLKNSNITFVNCYIEDYRSDSRFDLFVAANSIHWPDWSRLFPVLKGLSNSHTRLAIVTGGELVIDSIQPQILSIIRRYSTTQNFKPYSVVDLLKEQGYIQNTVIHRLPSVSVRQPVSEFIASFHARNGFSLDRMTKDQATDFRREMINLLNRNGFKTHVEGEVCFSVSVTDLAAKL